MNRHKMCDNYARKLHNYDNNHAFFNLKSKNGFRLFSISDHSEKEIGILTILKKDIGGYPVGQSRIMYSKR